MYHFRQISLELQKNTQQKLAEEEAWYRQQQLLLDAEDKRRKLIVDEEQKLTDQRTRLAALNREVKGPCLCLFTFLKSYVLWLRSVHIVKQIDL